jgi:hypothetical protein
LIVKSAAAGCNKLTREVRIIAGQPWVECRNVLDKIPTRNKEGVHFGFAFNVPGATTRMDIPWGVMIPERDQLPGGNRNWLAFQRWVDISNDKRGVTWGRSSGCTATSAGIGWRCTSARSPRAALVSVLFHHLRPWPAIFPRA